MQNCVKLLYANTDETLYIPPIFLEADGSVSLDTDTDFSTKLTKQLEELTDVNKIKTDGILGNSLPSTPKNDALLKRFALANILDNKFIPFTVLVIVGSKVLKQTRLYVSLFKEGRYEIEFKHEKEHWLEQLSKLTLNEVILSDEKFKFNLTNITDAWLKGGYQDTDEWGVQFPLTWFGRFIDKKDGVGVSDFRPWIYALWFAQKMCCQIGWKFRSPWLESEIGRRHISYLLSKNMGAAANLLELRKFSVRNPEPILMFVPDYEKPVIFTNVLSDPSGSYNASTGIYTAPGISDIHYDFTVRLNPELFVPGTENTIAGILSDDAYIRATLMLTIDLGGGVRENYPLDKFDLPFHQFDTDTDNFFIRFQHTVNDVQLDANMGVFLMVRAEELRVTGPAYKFHIETDGRLWNEPTQLFINKDDEFKVQDLLDEEETCLDFLKGEIHKCAGKVYTNYITNEIWLYSTYDTKLADDSIIEGFFIEETIDISSKIQKNSESIVPPNKNLKRYMQFKFKGEGDDQIKRFKLTKERYYLDYKVDFGDQFEDDTETLENPFYSATGNYKYSDKITILNMTMPALLDNDTGKSSFDVGMRTLYWHGLDEVLDDSFLTGTIVVPMLIFGEYMSNIPVAYQFSDTFYTSLGPGQPDINIAYGEPSTIYRPIVKDFDLFNLFYKRWIYETRFNLSISLLVYIDSRDFFNYSLRNKYQFISNGRTVFGRIFEIRDFDVCDIISTPVELIPLKYFSNDCALIGDGGGDDITIRYDPCIGNLPELLVELVGDCYQFSLGGTSSVVVDSVVFEYRYIGEEIWIADTEICNATGSFEIRMIVTYDEDCPEIPIRRTYTICQNNPKLHLVWDYDLGCLTIEVIGETESVIDTITIEYSENEVDWDPYIEDDCIEFADETTVYVRATVTYEGDCDETELTAQIDVFPTMNCEDITASVECTPEGGFNRIGSLSATPATDEIHYRYNEEDDWIVWTGNVPIDSGALFAKRVITFCNDECPTYCSEIVECVGYCPLDVQLEYGAIDGEEISLETNFIECDGDLEYKWYLCDVSGNWELIVGEEDANLVVNFDSKTYKVVVTCGDCFGSAVISVSDKFAWSASL